MSTPSNNAVVLLSGGLDSATTLAMASERGFNCYVMSFDYGQRSQTELAAAKRIAADLKVKEHRIVRLNLEDFGGSALTDNSIEVPDHEEEGIPVT
ncbi:MAG: 7-cyano-7-deazaguanine synthase, partial [Amphritea sp.]|nr:7-cyano-7-deazaguanine synthase [Amphritea sp.]